MSWQKVKGAFFVEKNGELQWIDIGVCANCNGIHIPAEEANGCSDTNRESIEYEDVVAKFQKPKPSKKEGKEEIVAKFQTPKPERRNKKQVAKWMEGNGND